MESPYELYLGTILSTLDQNSTINAVHFGIAENYTSIIKDIETFSPNAVYLHLGFDNYKLLCHIGAMLKQQNPYLYITCGYEVPTHNFKKLLIENCWLNSAIIGEPELTAKELFYSLAQNHSIQQINGLAYIEDHKVTHVPGRSLLLELDKLPLGKRFITQTNGYYILGARGCQWKCSYCDRNRMNIPTMCNIQRYRSISNITQEIDMLVRDFNCKHITFFDSSFASDINAESRLQELYTELRAKKYWVQFFLFLRPSQITNIVLTSLLDLKLVGLHRVFVGIETGNTEDLLLYQKPISLDKSKRIISMLNSVKEHNSPYFLYPEYGFINFNPFSTLQRLKSNLMFLRESNIEINPFLLLTKTLIYPGTELAKKVIESRLNITSNFNEYIDFNYQDSEVEHLYHELENYAELVNYERMEKYVIVYNRFIHFFGIQNLATEMLHLYRKYSRDISDLTYQVASLIFSYTEWKQYAISKLDEINSDFHKLNSKYFRMMISLQKIGESTY